MNKSKRKTRPWWRKPKNLRRLAIISASVLAIGVGAWLLLAGGGGGTKQYLVETAPRFSLPTTAGDQFVMADHVGKHNLLLYFNEGMG